jgi:hypothetical protein
MENGLRPAHDSGPHYRPFVFGRDVLADNGCERRKMPRKRVQLAPRQALKPFHESRLRCVRSSAQ